MRLEHAETEEEKEEIKKEAEEYQKELLAHEKRRREYRKQGKTGWKMVYESRSNDDDENIVWAANYMEFEQVEATAKQGEIMWGKLKYISRYDGKEKKEYV